MTRTSEAIAIADDPWLNTMRGIAADIRLHESWARQVHYTSLGDLLTQTRQELERLISVRANALRHNMELKTHRLAELAEQLINEFELSVYVADRSEGCVSLSDGNTYFAKCYTKADVMAELGTIARAIHKPQENES